MSQINYTKQKTVVVLLKVKASQEDKRASVAFMALAAGSLVLSAVTAKASDIPAAVEANGLSVIETVQALGVQIYECQSGTDGTLTWQFREPLATLMTDGKTVGRHFAGPGWELTDGSQINGKVIAQASGATEKDIPLLLLDVVGHQGNGKLSEVTAVQRLETRGGAFSGSCDKPGSLHVEPYSANYLFLK